MRKAVYGSLTAARTAPSARHKPNKIQNPPSAAIGGGSVAFLFFFRSVSKNEKKRDERSFKAQCLANGAMRGQRAEVEELTEPIIYSMCSSHNTNSCCSHNPADL